MDSLKDLRGKKIWFKVGIVCLGILFWPLTLFILFFVFSQRIGNPRIKLVLIIIVGIVLSPFIIGWNLGLYYVITGTNPPVNKLSSPIPTGFPQIISPTPSPTVTPIPEVVLSSTVGVISPTLFILPIQPSLTVTPTVFIQQRRIVMGSTPKGEEFYKKVESLYKQGVINGELYTEFESDAIVDVNPDMQSVQLSLKYPTIIGKVDEADKKLILNDFNKIKTLSEQDDSLILPDYGTLRLFVLTFHDKTGKARGELEQMMIDNEPQWSDWR